MSEAIFELTLADKLYRTKYEPDSDHPHITVKDELCRTCAAQPCVLMCPAEVYKVSPNDPRLITVSHDNCLECGTCIQVCPLGSVDWRFPDGGLGVKYRFG
jgi:ferredoxin like protein